MSVRVAPAALQAFAEATLTAGGLAEVEAPIVAGSLVWSDLVGRPTHGVWRLPTYVKRVQRGLIQSPCEPAIERPAPASLRVDGHGGFGQYVGHVAMEAATDAAGRMGIAVATVLNSNHFGTAAYFVELACSRGMIGLAFSNSVPKVAPFGGAQAVFGTNPVAFGAPRRDGRSILVDFSTASSAGSAIIRAAQEGQRIPEGIAIDADGEPITDPARVAAGALLPFGGAKGYGLGLMVEILCGVLAGAGVSHEVASMFECWDRPGRNGHCFVAIDIAALMPLERFHDRLDTLASGIKQSRRQKGVEHVLLPGEQRWDKRDDHARDGVPLDEKTLDALGTLARELGLSPVV
jgi:LDH2 family malate/lactate/ureidoglycolate dehydrogenase